jgi:hypothetical protein
MLRMAQEGKYMENIQNLLDDLELLCDNAMCFLKANTNGYQAAAKLKIEGRRFIQQKFKQASEISSPIKVV